jgi:hypothetical protein
MHAALHHQPHTPGFRMGRSVSRNRATICKSSEASLTKLLSLLLHRAELITPSSLSLRASSWSCTSRSRSLASLTHDKYGADGADRHSHAAVSQATTPFDLRAIDPGRYIKSTTANRASSDQLGFGRGCPSTTALHFCLLVPQTNDAPL